MGVLADDEWKDGTIVSLYVKYAETHSNFTYKLQEFRLAYSGQEGGYDSESKTSSLGHNERGKTLFSNNTGIIKIT
jgi:hypothetical protein